MQRLSNSLNLFNSSTSKQKYSFSKSPRFKQHNRSMTDAFYDLPTTRAKRSTSFGFGKKNMGLNFNNVAPSPEAYNLGSTFKNPKKGFSFGEGREDMEITGPMKESILKRYIPSPNAYYPKVQTDALNITLKSRIRDRSLDHLKKLPGPGQYNWEQIGSSNYYIISKHPNNINHKISQISRPETVTNIRCNNPKLGPGSYDLKGTEINKSGEYYNSKIKNSQARRFSRQVRPEPIIKHLLTNPGPTRYQLFSDFGK